jgi:hypothetical protein
VNRFLPLAAAALLAATAVPVAAGEPSAVVEDVNAAASGVRMMDFVEAGRTIELGKEGQLVLGYLGSCQKETISGGTVVVGTGESKVTGGKVVREKVECDGGQLALSTSQAGKSGVFVMRNPPGVQKAPPAYRIFSAAPVVALSAEAATISFVRVDRPSPAITVKASGRTVDLATQGISLEPGATYRAEAGGRSVVFSVSTFAAKTPGPLVGRLVRL